MIAYSNENGKHITVSKTWMTFRSNIKLKKPDAKKHNLYYITLIKYKNEQNPSELLEARQVVTHGAGSDRRKHKDSVCGLF